MDFSSLTSALGGLVNSSTPLIAALTGKTATPKTPAATPGTSSNLTTYLLVGGGALLAVGLFVVLLGRNK